MNKNIVIGTVVVVVIAVGAYFVVSKRPASAGPYGGDLVPLENEATFAEVLASKDSGEVMAHVWDKDLRTPHPLPNEPITEGSDNNSIQLIPHPMPNDPAGTFNDWQTEATPMTKDNRGNWNAKLNLPPGRYEYKFVMDGQWCCEPGCQASAECPKCVPNVYGTMNRFVDVV